MTDKQKSLKGRMDSEGSCAVSMTQAEWDKKYGNGKTKTGQTAKKPAAKKK